MAIFFISFVKNIIYYYLILFNIVIYVVININTTNSFKKIFLLIFLRKDRSL